MDRGLPILDVATMSEARNATIGRERFTSLVLAAFSFLAVFLSLLGVHGVLSYQVAQRRREVGVPMALGASQPDVPGMIVRQGMTMTFWGLVVGVIVALGSPRLLDGSLYGITSSDPLTYVGVVLGLAVAALAGSLLPALRATKIDPMDSLRGD